MFTSGFLTVIMFKPEFKMRRFSPLKTRVKKPKTKGTKADSVEKVTVAELLPSLENTFFFCSQQNHLSKLLLLIKMVLLLALPHSFTK